jgi:hypothetical protein
MVTPHQSVLKNIGNLDRVDRRHRIEGWGSERHRLEVVVGEVARPYNCIGSLHHTNHTYCTSMCALHPARHTLLEYTVDRSSRGGLTEESEKSAHCRSIVAVVVGTGQDCRAHAQVRLEAGTGAGNHSSRYIGNSVCMGCL